jgi:hypothetical protein
MSGEATVARKDASHEIRRWIRFMLASYRALAHAVSAGRAEFVKELSAVRGEEGSAL